MSKLIYFGTVSEDQILLPKRISMEVQERFKGHSIKVTFERKRKVRSNQQNGYYWGCVIPEVVAAMIELGNELQLGNNADHELIHEFLKSEILKNGKDIILATGEVKSGNPSTSILTTTEMEEYLENIRRWAAENLNISIPEPNEQIELQLNNKK